MDLRQLEILACGGRHGVVHRRRSSAPPVAVGCQPSDSASRGGAGGAAVSARRRQDSGSLRPGRRCLRSADGCSRKSMKRRRASWRAGRTLGGTLRLVGGMTVCLYVFPTLLEGVPAGAPGVEVKLTPGATPRLVRQLSYRRRRSRTCSRCPSTIPSLVTEPVFREELLLVTAPQHPLARKKASDAAGPRAAAVRAVRGRIEQPARPSRTSSSASRSRRKVVTETENVEIIKALVRIRMGISIVPYQAVAREVTAGQLFCAASPARSFRARPAGCICASNRLPRAVVEMKRILERVRPRLKLLPGDTI